MDTNATIRRPKVSKITESVDHASIEQVRILASKFTDADDFIASLDGVYLDVLYRGGHDGGGSDVFMTDYYGHALVYASDDASEVEGYLYDPNTVFHFNDKTFSQFRLEISDYDPYADDDDDDDGLEFDDDDDVNDVEKENEVSVFREYWNKAFQGHPYSEFYEPEEIEKHVNDSDVSSDDILMNNELADPLIPLMQLYAREKFNKNIIAFVGSDYGG